MLSFLPRFRQMIAEAGRVYDTVPMSVILAQPDAELLKGYAGAGIDRAVQSRPQGETKCFVGGGDR
jgi:hypothetical protein